MKNKGEITDKDTHIARLGEIPEPPKILHERGTWPSFSTKLLAVVGSRALSSYGREACEKLIVGLSGYPISIVSGLALGADATAHKAALRAGLHTIAVPGSGLDDCVLYPRTNASLAREILSSDGLLLSEHEDTHRARPEDFPSRNRIMVGLSHAVLIVEAGPRSGTLITARLAHEYNRDLLCIPHRIGDPHGFGANMFIRLGATLVSEPTHILEMLGIPEQTQEAQGNFKLTDVEGTLYKVLENPMSQDDLIRHTKLKASDVLTALLSLELQGILCREFGLWRRS